MKKEANCQERKVVNNSRRVLLLVSLTLDQYWGHVNVCFYDKFNTKVTKKKAFCTV